MNFSATKISFLNGLFLCISRQQCKRSIHAQQQKRILLQRFCLIVRPQSLRLSVLVSVAAASSSVKYCSSCSSSPQRCLQELQLCYVCKRVCVCTFSSMWYLSFPFPTSNLHKEKRSEIEFLSSRTNGWKCLKEYSSAMFINVLPKEYCSFSDSVMAFLYK